MNDFNLMLFWTPGQYRTGPPFIFFPLYIECSMEKKLKYVCSVYKDRPISCIEYPWNFANSHFEKCIFIDVENKKLRTMEEQLVLNTEEEISEYCVSCGLCCHFGPAKCSKLIVING